MKLTTIMAAALAVLVSFTSADARQRHGHRVAHHATHHYAQNHAPAASAARPYAARHRAPQRAHVAHARPRPAPVAQPGGGDTLLFTGQGGATGGYVLRQGDVRFGYGDVAGALAYVRAHPGQVRRVVHFSAGANRTTMEPFYEGLQRAGLPLPEERVVVEPDRTENRWATEAHVDRTERWRGAGLYGWLGAGLHYTPGGVVHEASAAPKALRPALLAGRPGLLKAVYDISAGVVTLPDGRKLEAHSGLGQYKDNPAAVYIKSRGPTPPNEYILTLREGRFYGDRALRMNPVDEAAMHHRDGILAHSYLGMGGNSLGCMSLKDYPAFLAAFLRGEVNAVEVVTGTVARLLPGGKVREQDYARRPPPPHHGPRHARG